MFGNFSVSATDTSRPSQTCAALLRACQHLYCSKGPLSHAADIFKYKKGMLAMRQHKEHFAFGLQTDSIALLYVHVLKWR